MYDMVYTLLVLFVGFSLFFSKDHSQAVERILVYLKGSFRVYIYGLEGVNLC